MRQEPITMNGLISELEFLVTRRRVHRVNAALIVGLAGPPACGKSVTAEILMRKLEAKGIVTSFIPMDGYHYSNSVLEARGLSGSKGAPETLNVDDYAHDLQRAYVGHENFFVPRFSRSLNEPIANALEVTADSDVVITEGDYILLKEHPGWAGVHKILDLSVYIETPNSLRYSRLLERYMTRWDEDKAKRWIEMVDAPNTARVEASIRFADFVMQNDVDENDKLMEKAKEPPARVLTKADTKPLFITKPGE